VKEKDEELVSASSQRDRPADRYSRDAKKRRRDHFALSGELEGPLGFRVSRRNGYSGADGEPEQFMQTPRAIALQRTPSEWGSQAGHPLRVSLQPAGAHWRPIPGSRAARDVTAGRRGAGFSQLSGPLYAGILIDKIGEDTPNADIG